MKKYIFPVGMNALLVFLLSAGSISCMVTGFQMNVSPVILLTALIWAIICCVCWRVKYGWAAMLGIFLLYGHVLYTVEAYGEFVQLLQIMGKRFYMAYGWDIGGLFSSAAPAVLSADVTHSCTVILLVQSMVTAMTLEKKFPVFACLPLVLLPLITTLVTIDSVPDVQAIFVLILGLVLLVLTHGTRRKASRDGAKLTAMLLAPVSIGLCILLSLVPQSSYEKPDFQEGDFSFLFPTVSVPPMTLPTIDITLPTVSIPPVTLPPDLGGHQVNLDLVGPKTELARKVMTIRTQLPGTVYLRSRSYAAYQGINWDTRGAPEAEVLQLPFDYWGDRSGKLLIADRFYHNYYFTPYYADGGTGLQKGIAPNPGEEKEYSYMVTPLRSDWKASWKSLNRRADLTLGAYDDFQWPVYLEISDKTVQRAQGILDTLDLPEDADVVQLADTICSYVRSSASYDLNTSWMPSNEVDFALWFLTESDTGYCVHFATAATVLLRAVGIPARYVEGYTVQTGGLSDDGFYEVEVQQKHAHAWVEYYVPYLGWVIMDPTPAAGENPPPTTKPTVPTDPPTQPTEPTTRPTMPTTTVENTTVPTTSSATSQTASVPTSSGTVQPPRETVPEWLWKTVLWIALTALVLAGQWLVRLRLRAWWLSHGNKNVRAVRGWRYCAFLGKVLRLPRPEALFELAQKAKFSQYTITDEELAGVQEYLQAGLTAAKGKNICLRAIYRVIFAIY